MQPPGSAGPSRTSKPWPRNAASGDCRHRDEPECAVLEALDGGLLDRSHYDNFIKLLKEQDYQRRRRGSSL